MTPHRTKGEVGIRELHNHLSRYLALVGEGGEVVVTKRGRRIARLAPIDAEEPMERLVRLGLVTPPRETTSLKATGRRRVKAKGPVSELVAEQRR